MNEIPEMRVCGTCLKKPVMLESPSSITRGWYIACSNKKCKMRGSTPIGSNKTKLVKEWNGYYGLETPEVAIKRFLKHPIGRHKERMAIVVGVKF